MALSSSVRRRRRFQRAGAVACELPVLFTPVQWPVIAKVLRLTPRQRAVAELLCAEYSQRDISQRLKVSANTVRTHLRALYARLGVRSRVGVVIRLIMAERESWQCRQ